MSSVVDVLFYSRCGGCLCGGCRTIRIVEGGFPIGLGGSAPGEKLVAIYTCCTCRYGAKWAPWRQISTYTPKNDNEASIDLGRKANLKITSVTGASLNNNGNTLVLKADRSDGFIWGPHGSIGDRGAGKSKRPSPSSPPLVLSHLSGDSRLRKCRTQDLGLNTDEETYSVRFHWRPQ